MHKILSIALAALPLMAAQCDPNDILPNGSPPAVETMPTEYHYADPGPAMQAWRVVTAERGWTPENVAKWTPFVQAVMLGESAYCPALRRGAVVDGDCNIIKQGPHSDSGFGQVLMGYPKKNGWRWGGTSWSLNEHASWLCGQEGLCTPDDVVASPHASMTAFVALIERSGKSPWCYGKHARSQKCRLAP